MQGAFWFASAQVAPQECIDSVIRELDQLIQSGVFDAKSLHPGQWDMFSGRCQRHLHELESLWHHANQVLPPALEVAKNIIEASSDNAIKNIVIYRVKNLPELVPWQQEVIDKIGRDFNTVKRNDLLQHNLDNALIASPYGRDNTCLHFVQNNLFENVSTPVQLDNSLQWVTCRDYLEEVEIAISIIQENIRKDQLSPSDFAILIPDNERYAAALFETSVHGGLPLNGLEKNVHLRDLGSECVRLFLITRQRPAPVMALASLISSPLMPWSTATGMSFAHEIMKGRYEFRAFGKLNKIERKMLELIRSGHQTVVELQEGLSLLATLLKYSKNSEQASAAIVAINSVIHQLTKAKSIDWPKLLANLISAPKTVTEASLDNKNGVAIFREHGEPYRKIKKLFILGFTEDHFPLKPTTSAIFTSFDLESIQRKTGKTVESPTTTLNRARQRFKRQLMAASDQITFFVPSYDNTGNELNPSSSLIFMASLLEGHNEPENLLLSIDRPSDREKMVGIPSTPPISPEPSLIRTPSDLELNEDLVQLNKKDDGSLRPQSPSSLSTLMGSPLAWLFSRIDVSAREWCPEKLDILIQGTLAHEVFEHLFAPGIPLPPYENIGPFVPELLEKATVKIFPYLLNDEWHVERSNLIQEITRAAQAWFNIVSEMDAIPIGAEPWLSGNLNGTPIRGKADLLIQLPSGQLLVVDYKKSSSSKRRKQMSSGYDCQAELYRQMVMTNGIPDILAPDPEIRIGSMYYLMNDQTALVDTLDAQTILPAGVEELGDDIAGNAMELIQKRLTEVKSGHIHLNRTTDESWFDKNAGMKLYALDDSPLIRLFFIREID